MTDLSLPVALIALMVAGVAVVVPVVRGRNYPITRSREIELERKVATLERELTATKSTVDTLLRALNEKEQRNHVLEGEIAALTARVKELERSNGTTAKPAPQPAKPAASPPQLLVVLGKDPALRVDLDALRGVERSGKFTIARPYPDSLNGIRVVLDRWRNKGDPIRYVHFAVHSAPEGIEIGNNELITPTWLSDNLKSVQILFLNGCRSDAIGDWLGIVPYVVAMRHEVANTDAVQFAFAFWDAIGDGLDAEGAFRRAKQRSPQNVSEFVELLQ